MSENYGLYVRSAFFLNFTQLVSEILTKVDVQNVKIRTQFWVAQVTEIQT